MEVSELEVRTVTIELGGGRRLSVSRCTDPTTSRDVLTLAEGWPEDGPMPGRRGETLELPADVLPELRDALDALDSEGPE